MTKALSFGSDGKLLEFVPQISDMSGLQNSLDGKANLSGGNTLTGTQTFRAAATQDSIKIAGRAGGTSSYSTTITPLALSANRTLSAPDADGTIATLSAQTFTGAQRFPAGTAAAPSILLDDVDTGFYRAGTNQIGISCAGKTIATITSANWLHYGFGIELPIDIVRANGTETAPTKVLSGESLGRYGFRSYYDDGIGGAGYSTVGCAIRSIATEDHNSNTNLGQQFEIRTVVNGAGSATTRAIVFNQGTLGVGLVSGAGATYISPASIANNAPKLQSLGASSAGDSAYLQARFDATAGDCPQHVLAKSRGTALADYTAVASGDTLGIIAGEGADGTEFIRAGSIRCVVDGTVSTGVVPGSWVIYTNNASGTAIQAVKIDSSQNVAVTGNMNIGSGKQYQIGGVQLAMEDLKTPADVTTNNVSTAAHGLQPKLPNDASLFLNGVGGYSAPVSGGGAWAFNSIMGLSANQTTDIAETNPVKIATVLSGGDHTVTNYRVKILAGEKAELIGNVVGVFAGSTGYVNYQWYSIGDSALIGKKGTCISVTHTGNYGPFAPAVANVTAAVDSEYELRIVHVNQLTNIDAASTSVVIHSVKQNGIVFSGTADKTVANTTTETSLIPTGVGSVTLPANAFSAGKILKIYLCGRYSTKGTPAGNITVILKLGSTTIVTTGTHSLDAGETNQFWRSVIYLTCRTTGTSGTVIGQSAFEHSATTVAGSNLQAAPMVATSTVTLNTTTSQAIDQTVQFSTADASNTITTTCCHIEWLN